MDLDGYFLGGGRRFEREGLVFVYDELPELELVGVDETEGHLARAVSFVLTGAPRDLGPNRLDVAWRPRR